MLLQLEFWMQFWHFQANFLSYWICKVAVKLRLCMCCFYWWGLSDFSTVASSHMVQEVASVVTALQFSRWLPDFRRGSGYFGGLVLQHVSQGHFWTFQPGVCFLSPPNKSLSHFIPYTLLYLNYLEWILFSETEPSVTGKQKIKYKEKGW